MALLLLLSLLCWRGPASFAHEFLCRCSFVEVLLPIAVTRSVELADIACILALALLTLLWRRGPAAFAHKLRGAAIVEVLLPLQAPFD